MDISVAASCLPLYTNLLGIYVAGHSRAWLISRFHFRHKAPASMQSLGRLRLWPSSSGSKTNKAKSPATKQRYGLTPYNALQNGFFILERVKLLKRNNTAGDILKMKDELILLTIFSALTRRALSSGKYPKLNRLRNNSNIQLPKRFLPRQLKQLKMLLPKISVSNLKIIPLPEASD